MALIDDFIAKFPEIDSSLATTIVPLYENSWECYYGGSYDNDCDREAILLLMAHFVTTDPSYSAGNMGPSKDVSSQSVGSVSVTYRGAGDSSDFSSWIQSTRYGQLFWMKVMHHSGPQFL